MRSYRLSSSDEVLVTSESGERLSPGPDVVFRAGRPKGNVIEVFPERKRQELHGIGTSFTEASAFVLAHLSEERRGDVMRKIYSEHGANFALARTPIGSCDFCVEGGHSYADVPGDRELRNFSVAVDADGFSRERYPGVRDEGYDLLPMIREALAIKGSQRDHDLRIISSAWTAPYWMKDIEAWYEPPGPGNGYQGNGGVLKPGYEGVYADYLLKYLDAYEEVGVTVWGLTPVNEPLGNNGQWESMHFSPQSQRDFIKGYLGPRLRESRHSGTRLLMYDHARDRLEEWADVIYSDPDCAGYVDGAAVHWYESTFKVYEEELDRVHEKYPGHSIVHTEGCIDNIGNDAPAGAADGTTAREAHWFDNDEFWWNDTATDWAYGVDVPGVDPRDHPIYTPVHRYARNIIQSLNHWVAGWVDWNIVLDRNGGPNHVDNYCGAPIMVDLASGYVYYTPIYYVLAQFSRTIRPGDVAVATKTGLAQRGPDALHAFASISTQGRLSVQVLNTARQGVPCNLQVGDQYAELTVPANSLTTVRLTVPVESPSVG